MLSNMKLALLFLALLLGAHAGRVVTNGDELALALLQQETEILVSGTVHWLKAASLSQSVLIAAQAPGACIVLPSTRNVVQLASGVNVTFRGVQVTQSPTGIGPSLPDVNGPFYSIDASLGTLVMDSGVVVHSQGSVSELTSTSAWWRNAVTQLGLTAGVALRANRPLGSTLGSSNVILLTGQLALQIEEGGCFPAHQPDSSIAYDSPSLAALIAEPSTKAIYVTSPGYVLMPRDFTWSSPLVRTTPLTIHGCHGTVLEMQYNWTVGSVHIQDTQLRVHNITLRNLKAMNRMFWPNMMALQVSTFHLVPYAASVVLQDVTLTTPDTRNVTGNLEFVSTIMPPDHQANTTYSLATPNQVVINHWYLTQAEWTCNDPSLVTQVRAPRNSSSFWRWDNVTVFFEPETRCNRLRGIKVLTGSQLRQLIEDPLIPVVEVGSNIKWNKNEWPAEAGGPFERPGLLHLNKSFTVVACHETPGQRYEVDFGDLGQVLFVFGRMTWLGDLRMTNPRASPRRNWLYMLVGALSVEEDGVVSFEDVEFIGNYSSPFHNADDSYWQTNCGELCPYFIPSKNSFVNGSYYDTLVYSYQFYKREWVLQSQRRNITGSAYWNYVNVLMRWFNHSEPIPTRPAICVEPDPLPPPPLPPPTAANISSGDGGGKKDVPAAAIAVPVAVGGAAVLAVAAGLGLWARARKRRAAGDGKAARSGPGAFAQAGDSNTDPTDIIIGMQPAARAAPGTKSSSNGSGKASGVAAGEEHDAVPGMTSDGAGGMCGGGAAAASERTNSAANMSGIAASMANRSMATEAQIESIRRNLATAAVNTPQTRSDQIALTDLLGEGTFGRVYKGVWRGTTVAVKTLLFPASMSGREKREKMAIMETAISASLSHPNVVQTYTYAVRPVMGDKTTAGEEGPGASITMSETHEFLETKEGGVTSWEVRLVIEFCDKGSLRDALNRGVFVTAESRVNMVWVVETALDVARAMLHLHSENIIHSDLKARNILLKSGVNDSGRPFTAKVADFGLSLRIDPGDTHVSNMFQGTMTHMAPEVLIAGKISKASDVYAYGVLLWELYTGGHAFKGVPRALLGHEITKGNKRPEFPADCLFDFQLLACRCWESDATIRPSFQQVLDDLARMLARLTGAHPQLVGAGASHSTASRGSHTSSAPGGAPGNAGSGPSGSSSIAGPLAGLVPAMHQAPGNKLGLGGAAMPLDTYNSVMAPDACGPGASEGGRLMSPSAGTFVVGSAIHVAPVDGSSIWHGGVEGGAPLAPVGQTRVYEGHAYMATEEGGSEAQSATDSVLLPPYMRRGQPGMATIEEQAGIVVPRNSGSAAAAPQ